MIIIAFESNIYHSVCTWASWLRKFKGYHLSTRILVLKTSPYQFQIMSLSHQTIIDRFYRELYQITVFLQTNKLSSTWFDIFPRGLLWKHPITVLFCLEQRLLDKLLWDMLIKHEWCHKLIFTRPVWDFLDFDTIIIVMQCCRLFEFVVNLTQSRDQAKIWFKALWNDTAIVLGC